MRVIRKKGDDAAALVEVEQARHAAHTLADIRAGPGNFFDRFEEFLRDEVGVCVNAHEQNSGLGKARCGHDDAMKAGAHFRPKGHVEQADVKGS